MKTQNLVYDKSTNVYEKETDSVIAKEKRKLVNHNIDKFNKMTRRV